MDFTSRALNSSRNTRRVAQDGPLLATEQREAEISICKLKGIEIQFQSISTIDIEAWVTEKRIERGKETCISTKHCTNPYEWVIQAALSLARSAH